MSDCKKWLDLSRPLGSGHTCILPNLNRVLENPFFSSLVRFIDNRKRGDYNASGDMELNPAWGKGSMCSDWIEVFFLWYGKIPMDKTHLLANIKHADNWPQVMVMSVSVCTLSFIGGKFLLGGGYYNASCESCRSGKSRRSDNRTPK